MKLKITIDDRVYEVEVEASEPEPEPLVPEAAELCEPEAALNPLR